MGKIKRKDTCLIATKSMHNNLHLLLFQLYSTVRTIKSHSIYIETVQHTRLVREYEKNKNIISKTNKYTKRFCITTLQ